jgi:hypothetical protein
MIEKHENKNWTHEVKTFYFSSTESTLLSVLSGQKSNRDVCVIKSTISFTNPMALNNQPINFAKLY